MAGGITAGVDRTRLRRRESDLRRRPRAALGVIVLAGQVMLPADALADAGIREAHAIVDFAGSLQSAIDDADDQLAGLARRTAAELRE